MRGQRVLAGYVFISPFILGFLFWFIGPMLTSVWLAFTDWDLIHTPRLIGMRNFQKLLQDDLFWQALKVTTNYTLVAVPLGLLLSFLLALLLNMKVKGIAFYRTVYYLPSIVPAVANAVLWVWVFNSEFGLLNVLLRALGLPKILWLQDPQWALPALILMSLWGVGGAMVIFLAGLQGFPDVFYEAAEIDGAGRWHKLRYITIPLLSPVIFFNLVMGIIASYQTFTAGYLVTNGGPQNATLFYVLYLYLNAFRYLNMGYASALAWVLFLIIVGLTVIAFKQLGQAVHYEDVG